MSKLDLSWLPHWTRSPLRNFVTEGVSPFDHRKRFGGANDGALERLSPKDSVSLGRKAASEARETLSFDQEPGRDLDERVGYVRLEEDGVTTLACKKGREVEYAVSDSEEQSVTYFRSDGKTAHAVELHRAGPQPWNSHAAFLDFASPDQSYIILPTSPTPLI